MPPRAIRSVAVLASVLALSGCSAAGAPAVPIFGSFFPAWIICAVGGIILAVIIRALLIALRIDEHLPAPPLVYLCLAISCGIGFWMIWSGAA
jgi:hypothetical protein